MNRNISQSSRQRGGTLAGLMLGLLIGVIIAVAVAVFINFGASPFKSQPDAPTPAATDTKQAPASASGPAALPGKPGDKVADKAGDKPAEPKTNYDFYKVLPGGEAAATPTSPSPSEDAVIERIFVQAGAFNDPSDADNLKARLALMGMEASVQRVEVPDKGTMQRVRLGPYPRVQDAEAVRAVLAKEGIETAIVRSKPRAQ